jgi:hypothetical protein
MRKFLKLIYYPPISIIMLYPFLVSFVNHAKAHDVQDAFTDVFLTVYWATLAINWVKLR